MEKLHQQFVDGCLRQPGMTEEMAEELFRQVAAFASFGFAKIACRGVRPDGLRIVVPEAVLPGPVPGRAHQRPADGLLPGRGPRQRREAPRRGGPAGRRQRVVVQDHDRMGGPARASRCRTGPGSPPGPSPIRSPACVVPSAEARDRWTPEVTAGWGVRLGLHLVKGIGEQHEALLDRELARGPYASLVEVVERTGLPEEVLERLIRTGALDSLGRPRRELLWQLREVAGASRGRVDGRALRGLGRAAGKRASGGRAADGPAAPRDRRAGTPRDHRIGTDRRCLRGHRPGCAPAGRDALPAGAGPARRGDQRGALGTAVRARSGSAGWSSPASTR